MPGKSQYQPKAPQDIDIINEWAHHLHDWALKVHERLWPEGEPDPIDPPPPPPFGK